jgi:hypothetical protein
MGDTLGKISKRVYGTVERWKEIWKNNEKLIKDPNKIYAGFTLYYVPDSRSLASDSAPTESSGGSSIGNPVPSASAQTPDGVSQRL